MILHRKDNVYYTTLNFNVYTWIKKILGLESGKCYESLNDVYKTLRYGKIMIMTDQDHINIIITT